jgi:hypothetical protein
MKFTYRSGQRPLDGFTIKRGVGQGGFGEVYFAVSDGGKEVALKLCRGQQDTELRGIAQCLNLKHPNLVHLYDLRTDPSGEKWVVMEYVSGETLNQVLNRHPRGLPIDLAREWFLALTRAVGHLHDHGTVHRDLKPANIFLENGVLKVGDYGLCKSMSASQRTAQTHSVGTVHYMAPEISTGNYNKQIDVYAAGVILYEMLTGAVPFDGESAGEILMKHLTSPPELGKLPSEYVAVVAKALAKNPVQRYGSMAELAQAVESLSKTVPMATPVAVARPVLRAQAVTPARGVPVVTPPPTVRERAAELTGSMALAAVLSALTTGLWATVARSDDWNWIGSLFFLTVGVSWAVLVPSKFWKKGPNADSWGRRFVMAGMGVGVGVLALWLDGWTVWSALNPSAATDTASSYGPPILREGGGNAVNYLIYFGLALGLLRWWKIADRRRPQWFSFFPLLAAGFWALTLLFVWPWPERPHGAAALVMAALVVQCVSPWEQPPPPSPRRLRLRYA